MTPPTCGYCGINSDAYCEDHDLEMTAAYRKGQMDKKAEIIKLLEELVNDPSGVNLKGAINLIKGESK